VLLISVVVFVLQIFDQLGSARSIYVSLTATLDFISTLGARLGEGEEEGRAMPSA
jgi:hypothetical protein